MKLLTDRLPAKTRSAVRFVIVGVSGTALQYAIYYGFLQLFDLVFGETPMLTTVAFGLGFGIEMSINYVVTCYYTFGSKPTWKNCGGFFGARIPNYLIQNGSLWLFLWMGLSDETAGIWAILIAGVVNYFMLTFVYKNNEEEKK